MTQKEFGFYAPCRLLRPYVRYYWTFGSDRPATALTFPTGRPQLIFHRKTPLRIPELQTSQSRLTVSGQVDFPAHLVSAGDTEMIVVVFRPHTMGAFLGMPVSLFCNLEVSGFDLGNGSLNDLAARIFDCGDRAQCIGFIERWLLARLAACPRRLHDNLKRMEASVAALLAAPGTSVACLASAACLSKKQFGREFGALVGMNPKEYAQIVRFHYSLTRMQNGPDKTDFAQIACACGYADQSHFIRECKRFSGLTPAALVKTCAPVSDLFADPFRP